MERFFGSGAAVDLILAIIVIEFFVLVAWRRGRSVARAASDAFFTLGPGLCLLMALRASLTGTWWVWIAFWLAASFPLHLIDLLRRRRSQ